MTHRERIIASINHRSTDKISIDLGSHRSSGVSVQAYKRLREYLGLPKSNLYVFDFLQQLCIIEQDVLDALGGDVVGLWSDYAKKPSYWQDFELEDGTVCKIPGFIQLERKKDGWIVRGDEGQQICIKKDGCLYVEQTCFPLADKTDSGFSNLSYHLNQIMWNRIGTPPFPDAGFEKPGLDVLANTAKQLRESTDRAVYAQFGGSFFEMGGFCFGLDNFLADMMLEPEKIHLFLDSLLENYLRKLELYLDAVGDYADIIGFGDDLGTQQGPIISPSMYCEFIQPRHRALWDFVKRKKPHLKIGLHSCGGIFQIIPHLIDAGLDILNPVQLTCKDMDLSNLKREYGKDLVFWGGGCDTRNILPNGKPDEIKKHVRKNLETLSAGSGFVFQQVHNILSDVPPQNIEAMFEAVNEFQI